MREEYRKREEGKSLNKATDLKNIEPVDTWCPLESSRGREVKIKRGITSSDVIRDWGNFLDGNW